MRHARPCVIRSPIPPTTCAMWSISSIPAVCQQGALRTKLVRVTFGDVTKSVVHTRASMPGQKRVHTCRKSGRVRDTGAAWSARNPTIVESVGQGAECVGWSARKGTIAQACVDAGSSDGRRGADPQLPSTHDRARRARIPRVCIPWLLSTRIAATTHLPFRCRVSL